MTRRYALAAFAVLVAAALAYASAHVARERAAGDAERGSAPVPTAPAAAATPATPSASAPAPAAAGARAADNSFVPPGRGVGAAKHPDLEKAPVVPVGQELKAYVAAFYDALRRQDWRRADAMVPPAEPGETLKDFERRQLGYEAGVANVLSAGMNQDEGTAVVVLLTPKHGVWNVTWRFAKTRRGVVVSDLVYARPGGAG